jgi:hypothetical protein
MACKFGYDIFGAADFIEGLSIRPKQIGLACGPSRVAAVFAFLLKSQVLSRKSHQANGPSQTVGAQRFSPRREHPHDLFHANV